MNKNAPKENIIPQIHDHLLILNSEKIVPLKMRPISLTKTFSVLLFPFSHVAEIVLSRGCTTGCLSCRWIYFVSTWFALTFRLVGGFGLCGIPQTMIEAVNKAKTKDLIIVSNNCGVDNWGLGILLKDRQVRQPLSFSLLDSQDDIFLCGREQRIRAPVSQWRS